MCPILLRLGGLTLYSYGFCIAAGFLVGLLISLRKARKAGIPYQKIMDIFFLTVLSAITGSRILFVAINFDYFSRSPSRIFNLWEGGLVFYGGLILAVGISVLYMRWNKLPVWQMADFFSPQVALGIFFGRIGCLLAGCCYGKETDLPWGIVFRDPNSLARLNVPIHPTQVYDAANGIAIFFFLVWMEKHKKFDGEIFWLLVLCYSAIRFLIEFVRGDPRGMILGGLLSTSQAIGIVLIILSIFMLSYLYRFKRS